MKIGIIGLGLIGGSIGLDLKAQGHTIYGQDNNPKHQEQALSLGIIHGNMTQDELISSCDVLIVAIPVNATLNVLLHLLNQVSPNQVIIDVGSTKNKIAESVQSHPNRKQYVAAHPMAGTEYTGPSAALTNLFKGKTNIICNRSLSSIDALQCAIDLFESFGMDNIFMDSEAHDKHIAYVSHLSHIMSFTLSLTVQDIESDSEHIYNMAGSGFRSTVRLAKSNADMWTPIFINNKENLIHAATKYKEHLENIIQAIQNEDDSAILDIIKTANKIKNVIDG